MDDADDRTQAPCRLDRKPHYVRSPNTTRRDDATPAAFISEGWPASDRNRWPLSYRNTRPTSSESAAQEAELAEIVEKGPEIAIDGVVRWRRIDLREVIEQRFGVCLHERTVGKILHKLGFCRLTARPHHPEVDPQAQETFKKTSPAW
jgi:transposase